MVNSNSYSAVEITGLYHDGLCNENMKNQCQSTVKLIGHRWINFTKLVIVVCGRHGHCLWPSLSNPKITILHGCSGGAGARGTRGGQMSGRGAPRGGARGGGPPARGRGASGAGGMVPQQAQSYGNEGYDYVCSFHCAAPQLWNKLHSFSLSSSSSSSSSKSIVRLLQNGHRCITESQTLYKINLKPNSQ